MKRRTLVVEPRDAGSSLVELVARALGLEPGAAGALVLGGAVYVGGRRCQRPEQRLVAEARVSIVLAEGGVSALESAPPPPDPVVLLEDADLVAVDKPAGRVTQPTPARAGDSLLDWVSGRFGADVGLVHRLDRETSGVVVFGRRREATSHLARQFREGTARKRYIAVVASGLPDEGVIDLPLLPDPTRPGRYRVSKGDGRPALTRFRRSFDDGALATVELWPETGRTHQLRAHLTALGFPIAGDSRYGGPMRLRGRDVPRMLLHAAELQISHPHDGRPIVLKAPLPEAFRLFGA